MYMESFQICHTHNLTELVHDDVIGLAQMLIMSEVTWVSHLLRDVR